MMPNQKVSTRWDAPNTLEGAATRARARSGIWHGGSYTLVRHARETQKVQR